MIDGLPAASKVEAEKLTGIGLLRTFSLNLFKFL